MKLLVVIFNDEKKIKTIFKKHKLIYNAMTFGFGTASASLLQYFGLDEIRKNVYFSLIPENLEDAIFKELDSKLKIKEIGKGIAFSIGLNSSSKFISDNYKGDEIMANIEGDYELIVTIVKEGYSDLVMQAAKSSGCTGGTVISGRSLGSSRTIFMDLAIEPEKDIVLNIVPKKITKDVMNNITKETGVKTEARGLLISLPIDKVVGLQE